jgi:hypothetical protein
MTTADDPTQSYMAYAFNIDDDLAYVFATMGLDNATVETIVRRTKFKSLQCFVYADLHAALSPLADDPNEISFGLGDLQDCIRFYNFYHHEYAMPSPDSNVSLSIHDIFDDEVWSCCYHRYSGMVAVDLSSPYPGLLVQTPELNTRKAVSFMGSEMGVEPDMSGISTQPVMNNIMDPSVDNPSTTITTNIPSASASTGVLAYKVEIKSFPTLKNIKTIVGTPFL